MALTSLTQVFGSVIKKLRLLMVNNISSIELLSTSESTIKEGSRYSVTGYHEGTCIGGGGGFTAMMSRHDGGTSISLTRTFPSDWTDTDELEDWFLPSTEDELCLVRDVKSKISTCMFGNTYAGDIDERSVLQAAIDNYAGVKKVVLPKQAVLSISDAVSLPSDFELVIDGELKLMPYLDDDKTMITNSDRVTYQKNITISGSGFINGNKSNQYDDREIRHTCIDFYKVTGVTIKVREVGSNKWNNAYQTLPDSGISATIQINDCAYCKVQDSLLFEWEHEGIGLDSGGEDGKCYTNSVSNVICEGSGVASFSGIQVGGVGDNSYNNLIDGCVVSDTGASAIGLDSNRSAISNCTIRRVAYFHGLNLGHSNAEASYSAISNIQCYDIGYAATTQDSHAINVANGTTDVSISNVVGDNIKDSLVSLSVADNTMISNVRGNNLGSHGFKLNVSHGVKIENARITNQGGSLLSDVGTTSEDLWYEINNTVVRRYGAIEGTSAFAPSIEGDSGAAVQNVQTGYYERDGRTVNFNLRVSISDLSTLSGNIKVTGLPFTSSALTNNLGSIVVGDASGLNILLGQSVSGYVERDSNYIVLKLWDLATGTSNLDSSELTNTAQFFISGSYTV